MAHLAGVQRLSDEIISYGGATYRKTKGSAEIDDIILAKQGGYLDVDCGDYFLVSETRGGCVGFLDNGKDARGIDDEHGAYGWAVELGDFELYRPHGAGDITTEDLRTLIEARTSELAELQRLLDEQTKIDVGDLVVLTGPSYNRNFSEGAVAKVRKNDSGAIPFHIEGVLGGCDWIRADNVKKITQEEARTLLYAKVDESLGL